MTQAQFYLVLKRLFVCFHPEIRKAEDSVKGSEVPCTFVAVSGFVLIDFIS